MIPYDRINYSATHDQFCKSHYPALIPGVDCSWCQVIRQVRADEAGKRESFRQ